MYFDQQTHACACVHMVKNNEIRYQIVKKVLFSSSARETHLRLTQEQEEKLSFLAFRSDSQIMADTQKLVAHYHILVNLVILVSEPLVSMIIKH